MLFLNNNKKKKISMNKLLFKIFKSIVNITIYNIKNFRGRVLIPITRPRCNRANKNK